MKVTESERLILRTPTPDDAVFLCRLLNEPSWLENIGDRGVRTPAQARHYIRDRLLPPHASDGYGMYVVATRTDHRTVGLCGLVRRESLPGPDLGFALLPEFWGRGYAFEAASAVMVYARDTLRLPPLLAITTRGNVRSGRLLEKLGFEFQRLIRLEPQAEPARLYAARWCAGDRRRGRSK